MGRANAPPSLRLGRCRLGERLSALKGPGLYEATMEGAFGSLRPVRVERLADPLTLEPTAITAFIEEGRRRTRLDHPVLLDTYELAQSEEGEPFLIGADPRGPDLCKLIAAEGRGLPPALCLHLVLELTRALEQITAGDPRWCGRLEAGRVFVSSQGAVRLGLGVPVDTNIDAHAFLAPELLRGGAPTPRSDVYALAVLLGLTARGRAEPAPGPPSLASILAAALATDPKERPELRAFRERLEIALDQLGPDHRDLPGQLRARASLLCPPTLDLEMPLEGAMAAAPRPPPRAPVANSRSRSGQGRSYWLEVEDAPLGPFSGVQLFQQLQALPPDAFARSKVSADGRSFHPSGRFLELLGEELPPSETPLHHLAPAGPLRRDPLPAVLARLAKARATGRLILIRHDAGLPDRRELHLKSGQLVHAASLGSTLRLWECLLTARRFGGQDLSTSLHAAVRHGVALELRPGAAVALAQARALETRRLLRELLTWKSGEHGFDEDALPRPGRPTQLLPFLRRALYRACSVGDLRQRLAGSFDRPYQRSDRFESEALALGLLPTEQERIQSFGQGYTLTESLAQSGRLQDQRSALVLATLFVELGLLVPDEDRRRRTPRPELSLSPS